ncbi:Transcription factor BOA15 [Cladobotryum mycophilum]|uniref:Transcription factor BOA15 n=1 Tax=Cladobotryum mycophilum TaxID=491253 RepID=A0ABR0SX72_9HYPO
MASSDAERALRVCATCKARKKGCDKKLPTCTYCSRRNLICVYQDSPSSDNGDKSESNTPALLSSLTASARSPAGSINSSLGGPGSEYLSALFDPLAAGGPTRLEDGINLQVSRIFQMGRLSVEEIRKQFFEGFHKWLPIISPARFTDMAAQASDGTPPARFSLVLLAMCLVTLRPVSDTSKDGIRPESLYMTVKLLFAQLQSAVCASTALIQAGLIISAYEYACERLDAAYISIGTCVRMAHTLGLDKNARDEGQDDPLLRLKSAEEWNVWWGIVILERIVTIEGTQLNLRPTSECPGPTSVLPSRLQPGQEEDSSSFRMPPLSAVDDRNVDSFGRQAQAVYFLDQVLKAVQQADGAPPKLQEVEKLDREIQTFLMIVFNECDRLNELNCGVVAVAIRSLFILHERILDEKDLSGGEPHVHLKPASMAALDTVANIVTHAAHDHSKHMVPRQADTNPLCCVYNLRLAKKHIEERRGNIDQEESFSKLAPLLTLSKAVSKRWVMGK